MPDTSPPVSPYLTVRGAAAAIDFYKRAFNAAEEGRHMAEDGERIMHATIRINGGPVMLSDEFPEHGGGRSPEALGDSPVAISLLLGSRHDVDETHRRALECGAKSEMDPQDPFWGGRFAMLRDPFGHRWMLSSPH
jgi:PhnB protein